MGPIVGPKMKRAESQALALEQQIISEVGLSDEILQKLGDFGPGTRRDLVVLPESLSIEAAGPDALALTFALPPGSYATQLIGEYTRNFSPKGSASEAQAGATQSDAAAPVA
jgi:tRNA(Glu) U13 pseudouridine synthase TruD